MGTHKGKRGNGLTRATYPIGILEIGDKKYRVEEIISCGSHGYKEDRMRLTDQATGETIWGKYVEVNKNGSDSMGTIQ